MIFGRGAGSIRSRNTSKGLNDDMINPLFDGLMYKTNGRFTQYAYYKAARKVSVHTKPSNKVNIFLGAVYLLYQSVE